jgi:hypothetical protein
LIYYHLKREIINKEMANVVMANVITSVANAVANAVANEVQSAVPSAVGPNIVGASVVGANAASNGVGANAVEENDKILIKKWHLAPNGNITTWVPHTIHNSVTYAPLIKCYTGHTNGYSTENGIMVDYEYTIPLTQIKKRKVKWQWQGLYTNKNDKDLIIEFGIEQHIQEEFYSKPDQNQTLKEINDIIDKLNEPIIKKYQPHNFRLSEGIVLCQHCGELLTELKKANLPSCIINL